MSFNFEDLNQDVREKMLLEIQLDISNKNLYISKRFSQKGINDYPNILIKHVTDGDEVSLGNELRQDGRFNSMEQTKTGLKKVPFNAHETLSEDQFNRFYVRALCLVAIETNKSLQVYRAKNVSNARTASQQKIGEFIDPSKLLDDLRSNGLDTALGLPAGPNSGLSVRLV
ncbi:hypothetical protein RMB03_17535 [Acinetobacter sp. V91_7]|uniref:hypothetical protein n=1 Tax=unclassified Acinetobacter TaxID=196816 RepID=UPI00287D62A7|nr:MULTISPECIES: hypothetical protein [unclassified Acinetobacter]MDS7935640.1 hypothetical protein [Acinetobacter sp. V91_4B]MDS7964752.1 hypothetical protein [Acinetobacter sp. V91_7]MDS8025553.1 hypothetical protein [Acinetobacter sp. V91_13]